MIKKILVIPDSHAKPGVSNERYTWLGKLIVEEKPEIIVNIGDMADLSSLSLYDKGKRSFEGRRYNKDVEAVIDAQVKLFEPIKQYNKSNKKKAYNPDRHLVLGNHEARIERATQLEPMLDGTISIEDLKYEQFGWKVSKFKDIIDVEGIYFSHYFTKGVMDGVISGTTATLGANILKEMKDNAVAGHSHLLSLCNTILANGRKVWGISCGCYFEHKEDYVSPKAQLDWWRGVLQLHVENREIKDIDIISLSTIKKEYK